MCTICRQIDLGFTQERYPEGVHMCFVFRDEAERRAVVADFVAGGIRTGEAVRYYADSASVDDVDRWLAEHDVDISPALETRPARDAYYPEGTFDPDAMCDRLRSSYQAIRDSGFISGRVSGEMSWALREVSGADRIIEYERKVNQVMSTHPLTAMCQYDANRFSGDVIFAALRVHPYMVMDRHLVRNPYYQRGA